eukprot:1161807-Pelagomonas_calceolata.AAC.8
MSEQLGLGVNSPTWKLKKGGYLSICPNGRGGGGEQEKESPGVQEHGEQPSRSTLDLFLALSPRLAVSKVAWILRVLRVCYIITGPFMASANQIWQFVREHALRDRPHVLLWMGKAYLVPAGMNASQVWGTDTPIGNKLAGMHNRMGMKFASNLIGALVVKSQLFKLEVEGEGVGLALGSNQYSIRTSRSLRKGFGGCVAPAYHHSLCPSINAAITPAGTCCCMVHISSVSGFLLG